MITSMFNYKLEKLTSRRDAAMNVNATEVALRHTDEILKLIEEEKKLRILNGR
jgi:hypothetical protein